MQVATPSASARRVPLSIEPMEARLVEQLPQEGRWQFEPKWDGFRCLGFRLRNRVELRAKSGKSLSRYFPEIVDLLRGLRGGDFVLDGELVVPVGTQLCFDALQQRLHPAASRVRRLAHETPATYVVFDCLLDGTGTALLGAPLAARRLALERLLKRLGARERLRLSPRTLNRKVAQRWLARSGGALDGVVAKSLDGAYLPGKRAMLKVKRLRTADCVVGGFRYASAGGTVGSLLLGLYDSQGKLNHVGFTSSMKRAERAQLTGRLESLIEPPGFTGRSPGAPSRWSTLRSSEWQPLRPELVVEVCYDHVTENRFRHGTKLLRWRADKAPRQCTLAQLAPEARPRKLAALLGRR
ncbi:MAG TPA: ATP-dependent DNA ligase [Steroidobacteraceae bacterium]